MARFRSLAVLGLSSASALALALGCGEKGSDGFDSATAEANASSSLVISQVYGGGGNTGAVFKHDFVELFNAGAKSIELDGTSIQYTGDALSFDKTKAIQLPKKTVAPGQYFLVQLGGGAQGGEALPKADHVVDLDIGSTKGKLALVPNAKLLDGCGAPAALCAADAPTDLIGFGRNASQFETAPVGELSSKTAAIRKDACLDTNDNASDFAIVAPAPPRNSGTTATPCRAGDAGADSGTDSGRPTVVTVLLNEVKINPRGPTDSPWNYAELVCTPDTPLDGYYFAIVEGDGDSSSGKPGDVDITVDLAGTKCGKNGIVYIKAKSKDGGAAAESSDSTVIDTTAFDTGPEPIEHATTSFVLIKSPNKKIATGDDLDPRNNGTLVLPAGAELVDGVSVFEQSDGAVDVTYGPRITIGGGAPDAVSRIAGNLTPMSESAWYGGDLDGDKADGLMYSGTRVTANTKPNARLTPGEKNGATGTPPPKPTTDAGKKPPRADASASTQDDDEVEGDEPSTGGPSKKPTPKTPPPQKLGAVTDCAMTSGPTSGGGFAALGTLALALLGLKRRKR